MVHPAQLPSKKITAFVLWLAIAGCTTATEQPAATAVPLRLLEQADSRISNKNGTLYFEQQPFSGSLYSLFPTTDDTAAIASYVNGREEGIWKKFYPDGAILETRRFEKGKKTGELIAWWPNGEKQLHYVFSNDEYEGTCREWNESGMLTREMNYRKGYEEGSQKWWYDNGKIKSNYIVLEGRRFGLLGTKNCINVSDSIFKN